MDQIRVRVWVDPREDELRVLTTKSKRWNMIRPYSLLHENEKSTCCSLLPPCFLPLYIESKIIPSSTIPDQEPNKIDSYYESLSLQNSHAHIRTYSQESRSKKILHIYTSMDQYSSSLVDTSLDLTIGITRMRVEEDSTVCFSPILDPLHLLEKFINTYLYGTF